MSIIARKFSACPVRTASRAWNAIVDVVAAASPTARRELLLIEGIAASIIADESPSRNPITIVGSGPRLRVYCLYEEDGSTEDTNESALSWNPFESEWEIYLPVEKEEMNWVGKALSEKGARFKAYEAGTKPIAEEEESSGGEAKELSIDISKL
jgi:hypothetical protein